MRLNTIRQRLIGRIRLITDQHSTGAFVFKVILDEKGILIGFKVDWAE
jgi:hypothetical protein